MRDILPGDRRSHHHPSSFPLSVPVAPLRAHITLPASRTDVVQFSSKSAGDNRNFRDRGWLFRAGWLCCLCVLLVGIGCLAWQWKGAVEQRGERGYAALEQAIQALRSRDLPLAHTKLTEAKGQFQQGSQLLLGTEYLLPLFSRLPGMTTAVSGIALMQSGAHLVTGAEALARFLDQALMSLHTAPGDISLLDILEAGRTDLARGDQEVQAGLKWLGYVRPESLPQEKQAAFHRGEALLPVLAQTLSLSVSHLSIVEELLGGNGPRTYLFLFQNNHELRPTGGFIGSYAHLDISHGRIRKFFVDGIFNPDGQLKENIIPPAPIQKISTGWSLHDSNWFPDFPTSAEKARFFYEKSGGPTTDGVIALTPEVLERALRILGPVDLPEYGVTIDADNFVALIQEEVEVKYDKEENNPKKILGDLMGVMLERLTTHPDSRTLLALADVLVDLLNERHILLFARDAGAQSLIETSGWSGAMLTTPYDYLSVVHANINGFKTDGVIKNSIEHRASIQSDGSILDTVTVTRKHTGGHTPYDWWNRVNADYMRVYVPLGSVLLSATGMTRETMLPPVDYAALNFRSDDEVANEEKRITLDKDSGTRVGEEFGKTVFGNWVYVSPGEEVTVTYRYRLPFRLLMAADAGSAPFSVLYQKQSGTSNWQLESEVEYPEGMRLIWQSAQNLIPYGRVLKQQTDLNRNIFSGFVFQSSQ